MIRKLLLFYVAISLASCSANFGPELRLDRAPLDDALIAAKAGNASFKAHVIGFGDRRQEPGVGDVNGKKLMPAEDPGQALDRLFSDKLRENGIRLALFDSPGFAGEVRDWYVSVRPAFPTTNVNARAAVQVKLFSPEGKLLYQGLYSGTSTAQKPFFSQSDIEEVLGAAMGEAVQQCLVDRRMTEKMEAYSIR